MDDTNQIEPPPSFAALYSTADGRRLTKPASFVVARYELCEDLALSLVERAATLLFQSGDSEQRVLAGVRDGLLAGGSLTPGETAWVVARLAELQGWAAPGGDEAGA
jgi:hypothetical protein